LCAVSRLAASGILPPRPSLSPRTTTNFLDEAELLLWIATFLATDEASVFPSNRAVSWKTKATS